MSTPSSPTWPKRRPKAWAMRCERYCCAAATYFPLAFVYSLTTWAVYVEASVGLKPSSSSWIGMLLQSRNLSTLLTASLCRTTKLDPRRRPLPSSQHFLHNRRLHRSRITSRCAQWWGSSIQCVTDYRVTRIYFLHRQLYRRVAVLQEMPMSKAGPGASLLHVQAVCAEDGPSLSVAGDLRWATQLQSVSAFPHLHVAVLLG